MTASLLEGKRIAAHLKNSIRMAVEEHRQFDKRAPSLAVVLVGDDPASKIYVTNKRKACSEVGIHSHDINLPNTVSENELLERIEELNQSSEIDGILVQLPLPKTIDSNKIIESINPNKDVDGFHPYNLGRLAQGNPLFRPCTPYGIMQLLENYQIAIRGQHAVVVGASNIVGRPMALEFLAAGATVTVCHRATEGLEKHIAMANIVVIATGTRDVLDNKWLKPNHILLDVGIHRLPNGHIRGDIDFESAKDKVAWITPVPGGVGPMTIIGLLQNTLLAAKLGAGSSV